jgi:endonuclease III related protein
LTDHLAPTAGLRERVLALYDALYAHFGHEPHWWPIVSDSPQFEIVVGAVLVQQTRWETAEAAVVRLRDAALLAPGPLAAADPAALAALIRPCAFYSQKAPGLQAIARYIDERHGGDVAAMLARDRAPLRAELLALPRIGRETADAIMLYAGGHPVFIVDAYARRLFGRLGLLPGFDFARARYDDVQALIEGALATTDRRPTTNDQRPTTDKETRRQGDKETKGHGESDHASRITQHSTHITQHSTLVTLYPSFSLRDFMWDFHALIIEECIHHCLATAPRQDRPGARRFFVDPRKCAEHCLICSGCPLREMCACYHNTGEDSA